MSNTRLTQAIRGDIEAALVELMNAPVRFIAPPPCLESGESKRLLWRKFFPAEILQLFHTAREWGFGMPESRYVHFHMMHGSQRVKILLGTDGLPGDLGGRYLFATMEIVTRCWNKKGAYVQDPDKFFGQDYPQVMEWISTVLNDEKERAIAHRVLIKDLLPMCVTAGQLKRMVPDLLKYLPQDKAHHLAQQTRASSLPFDWAAYPRDDVERAMSYIAKCHMLRGLGSQHRQKLTRSDDVTWVFAD